MPGRSKLSTSADLPGFRDPFLDVLKKFIRSLQGLEEKVSNMIRNARKVLISVRITAKWPPLS